MLMIEGKSLRAADARNQEGEEEEKNRTPSLVLGSDRRDVAGVETEGSWTGEKKAKIQSAPASGDLVKIQSDQGLLEQIEGYNWSDDYLKMATDNLVKQLNHFPPDYDDDKIWDLNYDEQLVQEYKQHLHELKIRLTKYRMRAYEGERLKGLDEQQLEQMCTVAKLLDEGYYEWCESSLEWYFDPQLCKKVDLQDYQRLILHNNGEYEDWDDYCKLCCTPEGDRQYVQFWEKLTRETRWWIEATWDFSSFVWQKLERVAFYQAVKIAEEFPEIYSTLIYSGFTDYMGSISFDNYWCKSFGSVYFEIWKRIAKQKMDFKMAVSDVFFKGVPAACSVEMETELQSDQFIPGPVTNHYYTYVADIPHELDEDEARPLIMDAVKKFVTKHKMYYDYAKKKLDIAEKMGLVMPQSPQK
uniref:Uncharacterized protein n=1 Tax=Arundo donax TaxID=35708 RepID=A0A0A8Y764_ARUDO